MTTKVKVGIAAVIVTALVALIVLDQGTTPGTGTGTDPAAALPVKSPEARPTRDQEEIDIMREADRSFKKPAATARPPIKGGADPEGGKEIKREAPVTTPTAPVPAPAAPAEEYVIRQGDTLESIALAKYGERKGVAWILKANPNANPTALRVGKKLVLPPKPEKPEETAKTDGPAALESANGQKIYVVQPGDTLGAISMKVYNTSRYADRIVEANAHNISDAHALHIGMKLVMPDLPRKESSNDRAMAGTGTVQTGVPAAAKGKTHQVQSGDSLWKIAAKYAGDKGVEAMIQIILDANADKLKDDKSMLRAGWNLVIPE